MFYLNSFYWNVLSHQYNCMNDIEKKLKSLEAEEQKIAELKQKLIEEQKEQAAKEAKLESLYKESGYRSPKELVEALITKFSIKVGSLGAGNGGKRTRTRITAEIREAVKADIAAGNTKVKVAEKHGISYVVVVKIAKGDYNHL